MGPTCANHEGYCDGNALFWIHIYIYLWVGGRRRDKEIIPIRSSQPNHLILNLHFFKNKIQSNSESILTWHSGRCTLLQPQRYGFKSRYPERIN